jgi:DNA damage-binding protein 1
MATVSDPAYIHTRLDVKAKTDAAKEAFKALDSELSRALHVVKSGAVPDSSHENHGDAGEIIKSVVLGGLDGIITTFAIVCAVAGAGSLGDKVVILMGVANLIADAISMGLGDYISEKAENTYINAEQDRERWEMENFLEGEISEMVDIYVERHGFKRDDAVAILGIMAKNREFFLSHMMVEELGLMPVDPEGSRDLSQLYSVRLRPAHRLHCLVFNARPRR